MIMEKLTDEDIDNINDSWELALLCKGLPPEFVRDVRVTVEDAITNNMGAGECDVQDP